MFLMNTHVERASLSSFSDRRRCVNENIIPQSAYNANEYNVGNQHQSELCIKEYTEDVPKVCTVVYILSIKVATSDVQNKHLWNQEEEWKN